MEVHYTHPISPHVSATYLAIISEVNYKVQIVRNITDVWYQYTDVKYYISKIMHGFKYRGADKSLV